MARKPSKPREPRGNFVSEWFGHRVYPNVVASEASVADQQRQACPFLSEATAEARQCIKAPASRGVCTVSTPTTVGRRDWLVCPYRALDPQLVQDAIRRLFGFEQAQDGFVVPAVRLVDDSVRFSIAERLETGGRVFIYFDEKLGGELSIPPTAASPEFSFDLTVIEVEISDGQPHVGRFGVIEIQTMDFHGSYRHVVKNLTDGLRLHPTSFPATLQSNQHWLSEHMEGPNIANVFKRTFYQMMFKFQLGQSSRCAGCVLAIPLSVWESWQRHLGGPELLEEADGTFSLYPPGRSRPDVVAAWIYAFDIDSASNCTPSPIFTPKIIATDAAAMSYFALEVAPAQALLNIDAPGGMMTQLGRRLFRLWPELARTITA